MAITRRQTKGSALTVAEMDDNIDTLGRRRIVLVIDGGGVTIASNAKVDIPDLPACTIIDWTMVLDASSTTTVDLLKSTYANYPTMTSITASAKPATSAAQKNTSSTLTGWTTTIAAGDVLRMNVDTPGAAKRITLTLEVAIT
jgi:hypothetical protein